MTSPSADTATGAAVSTSKDAPAAAPAPSGPITSLPTPAVGVLVTDVLLRQSLDPNTNVVKPDLDASGNHILDGAGSQVGVVVGTAADGTPLVAWLGTASAYGSPLASLIDPPTFP